MKHNQQLFIPAPHFCSAQQHQQPINEKISVSIRSALCILNSCHKTGPAAMLIYAGEACDGYRIQLFYGSIDFKAF